MKKTQRKLKLDTQTVTKLDDNSLTEARGGSGTHNNCTYAPSGGTVIIVAANRG